MDGLCRAAYLQRQRCALVTFGNGRVETLLKPQRALKDLATHLGSVQAGGGTPLRKALLEARAQLDRHRRQRPGQTQALYLFTDGRSRDAVTDIRFECPVVVVDTELTAVRLGRARHLAEQFDGELVALEHLENR